MQWKETRTIDQKTRIFSCHFEFSSLVSHKVDTNAHVSLKKSSFASWTNKRKIGQFWQRNLTWHNMLCHHCHLGGFAAVGFGWGSAVVSCKFLNMFQKILTVLSVIWLTVVFLWHHNAIAEIVLTLWSFRFTRSWIILVIVISQTQAWETI